MTKCEEIDTVIFANSFRVRGAVEYSILNRCLHGAAASEGTHERLANDGAIVRRDVIGHSGEYIDYTMVLAFVAESGTGYTEVTLAWRI